MSRPASFVLSFGLLALAAAPALRAQPFRGLGPGTFARGLSADGSVVVGYRTVPAGSEAFRWTAGGGLQRLPGFPDASPLRFDEQAVGVSADGLLAVGQGSRSFETRAARWSGTAIQDLGALSVSAPYSTANAVSADGSVVIGDSQDGCGSGENVCPVAFRWTEAGGMVRLGRLQDLGTFSESRAFAVSADGRVVVGNSVSNTLPGCVRDGVVACPQAVRWTDGAIAPLGVLGTSGDDLPFSYASAVSADGRVIVGSSSSPLPDEEMIAVQWTEGVIRSLGSLIANFGGSDAAAISADGRVVVGQSYDASATFVPVVWTAGGSPSVLRTVLEAQGADLTGWTLSFPTAISADGSVVVGVGRNPAGQIEGWRAELAPPDDIVVNSVDDDVDETVGSGDCDTGSDVVIDGEPVPECTLRAAIETANARGGASIGFDIPGGGVPRIQVTDEQSDDALPPFTARIVLDATTQPGGWVELVGPGVHRGLDEEIPGLTVGPGGGGSEVRGLVINRFSAQGVLIQDGANGCVIRGNRIGTDVTGRQALGNGQTVDDDQHGGIRVFSDGNRIEGNVIAGNVLYDETALYGGVEVWLSAGASGNTVVRNAIGVGSDGEPVPVPIWELEAGVPGSFSGYTGVRVAGVDNVVGGEPGAGNDLAGHVNEVIVREGGERTTISYNSIGPTGFPEQSDDVYDLAGAVELYADDNVVSSNTIDWDLTGIEVGSDGNEVVDNTVTGQLTPAPYLLDPNPGFTTGRVQRGAIRVSSGSGNDIRGNRIESGLWGVVVFQTERDGESVANVVAENEIVAVWGGVSLYSFDDVPLPRMLITRNRIVTGGSGIDFGTEAVVANDPNDGDDGPNDLLNRPVVQLVTRDGEAVTVEGFLQTPILSGTYTVEAFSNAACASLPHTRVGALRYGPGEHYLGSVEVSGSLGDPDFTVSLSGVPEGHRALTLTASRADLGVTSQFSRCVLFARADQVAQADVGPGQTGPVLDDQGTAIAITPALLPDPDDDGRSAQRHDGGTLFVTRYEALPAVSVFAPGSATAPDGSAVAPAAVAARTWLLADRGLTPDGGATSNPATFSVCLDPAGVVLPGALGSVVVVRRSERTAGEWTPTATTLAPHGSGQYLCADAVTALGEFGIGGAEAAFPVGAAEAPATPERPLALAVAAHPNPARGAATVSVSVPSAGPVSVAVFDVLGRRVAVLHGGPLAAGTHAFRISASALPAGVYVVRVTAGTSAAAQRLTVVR